MATEIGDLVLVYFDDAPAFFARVEDINPDHKRGWHHLRLMVLTVAPQELTWILKEDYISGAPFTMQGRPMRLEKVPGPRPAETPEEPPRDKAANPAKILSLHGRKK